MTSTGQPEGSSQPLEEHSIATPPQMELQFQDSSLTPSADGKDSATRTSHLEPQGSTLTIIATELRLNVYEHLFQSSATHLLRRRDGIDDEDVIKKLANTFDCNILFTCRKVYKEALPVFYATQTFHYSFTTGGLSFMSPYDRERFIRQGAMPYFSKKLNLMVNLSLGLEVVDHDKADTVLSKQVADFAQHCPQLRSLTIHLVIGADLAYSATGSVLHQLHPRLDSLSIIVLGSGPHKVISRLRLSIADDRHWSHVCISHRLDGTKESQWPYLTIPSMIQNWVHKACSSSKSSNSYISMPKDDCIYEWTCRNTVNEEVRLGSLPVANWVMRLEKQRSTEK